MGSRFIVGAVVLSIAAGCSSGKETGTEGGPCYGNGTCNGSLVCLSSLCVQMASDAGAGGADAATAGADAGTAGADAGGGATGAVAYSVSCAADGCGKSGALLVALKACGAGGATIASDRQASVTLAAGTPITGRLAQVAPGSYCVTALLDVDGSGARSAGDVASSTEEAAVTVVAGAEATIIIGLDTVVPGGASTGTVQVTWTVNGGMKCPTDGSQPTGSVVLTVAGVEAQQVACTTYMASLTVPAGVVDVSLRLTDTQHPGQTATGAASGITVVAGQAAQVGPIDLACTFCPQ